MIYIAIGLIFSIGILMAVAYWQYKTAIELAKELSAATVREGVNASAVKELEASLKETTDRIRYIQEQNNRIDKNTTDHLEALKKMDLNKLISEDPAKAALQINELTANISKQIETITDPNFLKP